LQVAMGDSTGRSLATTVALPQLSLAEPAGAQLVRYGAAAGGVRVDGSGAAVCRVSGQTDPRNTLELDGRPVALDAAGGFSLELPLRSGEQTVGVVLRGAGCSRLMNLRLRSSAQRNEPGAPL
jgi:hypothetical protein